MDISLQSQQRHRVGSARDMVGSAHRTGKSHHSKQARAKQVSRSHWPRENLGVRFLGVLKRSTSNPSTTDIKWAPIQRRPAESSALNGKPTSADISRAVGRIKKPMIPMHTRHACRRGSMLASPNFTDIMSARMSTVVCEMTMMLLYACVRSNKKPIKPALCC
jgi:hypothetical protein